MVFFIVESSKEEYEIKVVDSIRKFFIKTYGYRDQRVNSVNQVLGLYMANHFDLQNLPPFPPTPASIYRSDETGVNHKHN